MASGSGPQHWMGTGSMTTSVMAAVHAGTWQSCYIGRRTLLARLRYTAAPVSSRAAGAGLRQRRAGPGAGAAMRSQMHLAREGRSDGCAACREWATPSAWQGSSCTTTSRCRRARPRAPTLRPRGTAAMRRSLTRMQRLRRGMSRLGPTWVP